MLQVSASSLVTTALWRKAVVDYIDITFSWDAKQQGILKKMPIQTEALINSSIKIKFASWYSPIWKN
jgi:hypothetical protein